MSGKGDLAGDNMSILIFTKDCVWSAWQWWWLMSLMKHYVLLVSYEVDVQKCCGFWVEEFCMGYPNEKQLLKRLELFEIGLTDVEMEWKKYERKRDGK